jgi:hypothetical protein
MKTIITFILVSLPFAVSAQQLRDINSVALRAANIGNMLTGLAISFAVLWIIISVVRYLIKGSDDEEARKKGGDAILYGVIGLFAILSIWGLVSLLTNTFRFAENQRPSFNNLRINDPTIPGNL